MINFGSVAVVFFAGIAAYGFFYDTSIYPMLKDSDAALQFAPSYKFDGDPLFFQWF